MKKYFSMICNISKQVLIYLATQMVCGMVMGAVTVAKYHNKLSKVQLQQMINKNIMLLNLVSGVISLIIYILMFKNKEEDLWTRCRFKKISIKNSVLIIFVSIGIAIVSNSLIYLTKDIFRSYSNISNTLVSNMNSFMGVLSMMIFIPVLEEIFFRGLIFNELKKYLSLRISVILQALIFALFHGNVLQDIYTFVLGISLALIYVYTKSIWGTILAHCMFNLVATMIIPICIYYTKKYIALYLLIGIILSIVSLVILIRDRRKIDIEIMHENSI